MATLLDDGKIRAITPVYGGNRNMVGHAYVDLSPAQPEYEQAIMWLPVKDKARARALYAEAQAQKVGAAAVR